MPRPMTRYVSGIRTLERAATRPCTGCGADQTRTLRFTGVGSEPESRAAEWVARDWWSTPCWRRAGRPT